MSDQQTIADGVTRATFGPALLLLGAATVAIGFVVSSSTLPVVGPLVAALWIAGLLYASLSPGLEIGSVYAGVVALYTIVPLLDYLANGSEYLITSDLRLWLYQPTPADVAEISWLYVAHLAGFAVAYRIVRGRVRFEPKQLTVSKSRMVLLATLLGLVAAYFWILAQIFDLGAADYAGSYLVFQRLPLAVAQLTNHLGGIRFTLEIALIAGLLVLGRRYYPVIGLGLLAVAIVSFAKLWSRTDFVLLTAGTIMLYGWVVRRVRPAVLLGLGSGLLALFLIAGLLRGGAGTSELREGPRLVARGNEFETLFGNAYDLKRRLEAGMVDQLSAGFWLTDVLALVPQQVSPIAKVSPADWYGTRFFPDFVAQGYGFAFGSVSESVLGFGSADAALRGVALGILAAIVHRWAARRRSSFWALVVYAWATLSLYHCFRNTTFATISLFAYRVIPVVIVTEVLRRALWRKTPVDSEPVYAGA